jgi:ATP-dependent Clp protease ATP-binding subunit ClpA
LLDKQISLQESQISLLDSAGLGLRAQAEARQQVVQMLADEIQLQKNREMLIGAEKNKLLAEAQTATEERRLQIAGQIRDFDMEILDSRQKQVQATQKQADISKVCAKAISKLLMLWLVERAYFKELW